ncbi:hypothetical protein ACQ4PT_022137 [Festuca glaucescens]
MTEERSKANSGSVIVAMTKKKPASWRGTAPASSPSPASSSGSRIVPSSSALTHKKKKRARSGIGDAATVVPAARGSSIYRGLSRTGIAGARHRAGKVSKVRHTRRIGFHLSYLAIWLHLLRSLILLLRFAVLCAIYLTFFFFNYFVCNLVFFCLGICTHPCLCWMSHWSLPTVYLGAYDTEEAAQLAPMILRCSSTGARTAATSSTSRYPGRGGHGLRPRGAIRMRGLTAVTNFDLDCYMDYLQPPLCKVDPEPEVPEPAAPLLLQPKIEPMDDEPMHRDDIDDVERVFIEVLQALGMDPADFDSRHRQAWWPADYEEVRDLPAHIVFEDDIESVVFDAPGASQGDAAAPVLRANVDDVDRTVAEFLQALAMDPADFDARRPPLPADVRFEDGIESVHFDDEAAAAATISSLASGHWR